MREARTGFATAEWGFAIGSAFWGTACSRKARSSCSFRVRDVGVHRLEARAALKNGRGNGALRKMGAVQEGVLEVVPANGEYLDQALYAIVDEDGAATKHRAALSGRSCTDRHDERGSGVHRVKRFPFVLCCNM